MIAEGLDIICDPDNEGPASPDWLQPLTRNEERMRRWGRFDYRPLPDGAIAVAKDWGETNLVTAECPAFKKSVCFHRSVAGDYQAFIHAVISAGRRDLLLTLDETQNFRFQHGSAVRLSSHAWGVSFDINAAHNGLGSTPAYRGQPGSVRELVPLANQHGWFWGGHFKHRREGMHFEHV